jgi:hypothetical protein
MSLFPIFLSAFSIAVLSFTRSVMKKLFLKVDDIYNEDQALTWSINAALQRNKVYMNDENYDRREEFRAEWKELIRAESRIYRSPGHPVSDEQHCAAIARVADALSSKYGEFLSGNRLRFGTSQKAFNLYLKYLWALGEVAMPPHCPIDSVVLESVGLSDCWTKCDSSEEYMGWINAIRKKLNMTEWENQLWLRWRLKDLGL